MLRKLLSYSAGAFLVQAVTGLLTFGAEMFTAKELTESQYGEYKHYFLVYSLLAGPFIIGFDHALVTYVNRRPENYARFIRLLLAYCALLSAASFLAAAGAMPIAASSTVWGIACVGPFTLVSLGYIVLRAHLRVRYELALLGFQSLFWSLGSLAFIRVVRSEILPIGLSAASFLISGAVMIGIFVRDLRRDGAPAPRLRPFAPEYRELWTSYAPLWVAGAAFLANAQIVALVIDRTLGRVELAMWGFVSATMVFINRPLQIVQRVTLPIFTSEKGDLLDGFRQLVRMNLLVFPLLAIGLLGLHPLIVGVAGLEKYEDSWLLLAVVVATAPSMAVEYLVATVSMARDLPRQNRNAHVITALINVPASFVLVRFFGLPGAAAATAFQAALFGGMMFWFTRRSLREYVSFAVAKLLASIVCLAVALVALGLSPDRTSFAPAAAALYLAGAWVAGIWRWRYVVAVWERLMRARRSG
jgi:O-antigen/teichoic acid export membrane protein